MSSIGRLVFCTACRNLLDENASLKPVKAPCAVCGTINLSMFKKIRKCSFPA